MEWQPIETAPKNGTKVDLWFEDIGRKIDCYYRNEGMKGWCQKIGFPVRVKFYIMEPKFWMMAPSEPK